MAFLFFTSEASLNFTPARALVSIDISSPPLRMIQVNSGLTTNYIQFLKIGHSNPTRPSSSKVVSCGKPSTPIGIIVCSITSERTVSLGLPSCLWTLTRPFIHTIKYLSRFAFAKSTANFLFSRSVLYSCIYNSMISYIPCGSKSSIG